MPAALAFAAFVVLAALIARELGGRRAAQVLTAAGVPLAPYPAATGTALFTNAFDLPLWTAAILFTAPMPSPASWCSARAAGPTTPSRWWCRSSRRAA